MPSAISWQWISSLEKNTKISHLPLTIAKWGQLATSFSPASLSQVPNISRTEFTVLDINDEGFVRGLACPMHLRLCA